MLDAGSGDFIAEKSRREDVVGSKNNLKSSSSPNALSFYRRPGMPSSRDPGFSFDFLSFFSKCLHNE